MLVVIELTSLLILLIFYFLPLFFLLSSLSSLVFSFLLAPLYSASEILLGVPVTLKGIHTLSTTTFKDCCKSLMNLHGSHPLRTITMLAISEKGTMILSLKLTKMMVSKDMTGQIHSRNSRKEKRGVVLKKRN